MTDEVALSFREITRRLKSLQLPDVDVVVGITTGGVVPAALLAYEMEKPFSLLHINYRAENNSPQREKPLLITPFDPARYGQGQHVLLVDDVSVTGQTLELASSLLCDCEITTFVLKGSADVVVFPEISSCVLWPWKRENR